MAGFAAQPVDGSTTPIPMSSAVPDGTNTPLAVEGGPIINTGGNNLVPVSMYVKDGNDVAQGTSTDAAVTGDNPGTQAAKLRGLAKILFDMWDSTNHWLQVKVMNATTLGQAIMANSSPVVLASDQAAVKTKPDFTEQASLSASSLNADLVPSTDVSGFRAWSLHMNTSAFSGTLALQGSNDNVNWIAVRGYSAATPVNGTSAITAPNILFSGPIYYRYFRVRMTAYTSGTAQGTLELYTQDTSLWPGFVQILINIADVTFLASAAQTTTQTQGDQTNTAFRGIKVILDMTVVGTGSVTLEIDGKDGASGKYYPLLTGAAVTTNSTNVYTVYPGLTAAANVMANDVLPRTYRVKVVANNANSATYSVGLTLLD